MIQGQLPLPWTEFIGRQRERASLTRLLLRARLVTVVGLSGVGKSRLARQVAEDLLPEFAGEVWFVQCEGLASADSLLPLLRDAAGLGSVGCETDPERLPESTGRRALLLLDTAECLLETGLRERIRQWLECMPHLTVLLTSTMPTGMPGEHLFPLRPMDPPADLPSGDRALEPGRHGAGGAEASPGELEADGLRLFEARAQQRDCEWRLTAANLPTVRALCEEMDWLPLGIELAAGQLSPWSEAQLLKQLRSRGHQLDLTAPGSTERHESLRRAVAWSWSLLPERERSLVVLIATLGGQLLEEALEPVTGDAQAPALANSLFRKGFLQVEERRERLRYALPQAVRRFAEEQTPSPRPALERAAAFYLELAEREGSRLGTAWAAGAAELLRLEVPRLRRCWTWAREWGDSRLVYGFANALWGALLHELELPAEAGDLVQAALAGAAAGEERARLCWIAGAVAGRRGRVEEAMAWLRDCLEGTTTASLRALALKELGGLQLLQGQPLAACETAQQSVSALSQLGMEGEAAWARRTLAGALERLGDRSGAQRLLEEARLQFAELELPLGHASVSADLARLAADDERWETAEQRSQDAVRHFDRLCQEAGWAAATLQVARVRARQGASGEAQRLYREAFRCLRAAGSAVPLCQGLLQAAAEPSGPARAVEPAKAYRECILLAREQGLRSLLAHALRGLADLYATEGVAERALTLAEEAVQVARQTTEAPLIQACLELVGRIQATGKRPNPSLPSTGPTPSRSVHVESLVVRELASAEGHPPAPLPAAAAAPVRLSGRPLPLSVSPRVAPIRVRLLGGMSLFLGDEEVPLLDWWAKAKKLFGYLVIHRGRPVSRDILLEEFWPDGDQQRAIHSLQTTLSFLRRSLRSLAGGENLSDRLIVARDGNYFFDGESRCESDLQRFDAHFQEANRLKANGQLDEAAAHWMEADRLYVGDLLPEFPYEDWCASPRERVRSHYLELLLSLGTYHRQAQRPREALRTAERMFFIDACDERAHRMAMRCHVQLGRPVDALRQFERCCQILERELRVQPSKATRELHNLIRQRMDAPPVPNERPAPPSARSLE